MADFSVRVIHNITKEYPEMIKVVIYKVPQWYVVEDGKTKRPREIVPEYYAPSVTSLSRTRQLVRDIVTCNDFELFATFTFDPKKVNSFHLPACWRCMSTWIHHQSDKSRLVGKEFKYLIVPEQHKSGRWHFHALISGYTGSLRPSGHVSAGLRPIFNITSFRSGFTTCCYVDDREGVGQYVSKYITKEFVKYFNQRRFFCSRNLRRPKKEVNSPLFKSELPLFRRKVEEYSDRDVFILPCYGETGN